MANNGDQEIEVKFMVRDHGALEKRLIAAGAVLVAPRVHEINLRFDTPDWELTSNRRVLRLRQDSRNVLTYKGPAAAGEEVAIRTEIETEVADFGAAQRILEALGYRIAATYEKYRTTYQWDELEAVLDEMPYGDFLEIEGPDTARLQEAAAPCNWIGRRAPTSAIWGCLSITARPTGCRERICPLPRCLNAASRRLIWACATQIKRICSLTSRKVGLFHL